jgi:hypothetical protein
MTIPVHADDQLWSVDDVSTYLTVPAATLLRRTTRRRWASCSCLAGPGVGEAVLAVHGWRDAVEVVEGHPLGVMTLLLECADR